MEQSVILQHEGTFTVGYIDALLRDLKSRLKEFPISRLYAKRIYSLSVECLDNIFKHSDVDLFHNPPEHDYPAFFRVQRISDKHFVLSSGNLTPALNEANLRNRLEHLAGLTKEEVDQLYKKSLSNSEISEKGGAGLGIIVMTRLSGHKLQYDIVKANSEWVFFELTIHLHPKEAN